MVNKQEYNDLKNNYFILKGKKEQVEKNILDLKTKINNILLSQEKNKKFIQIFQKSAEESRNKAKVYIENIVTKALQYVFENDIRFEIDIRELRGKPNADFFIVTHVNGKKSKQDPITSCGGGLVDIISTALRYTYLELFNNPKIRGPIILDEPGKMISEKASIKFAEFIKYLCDTFDRQTILITHNENIKLVSNTQKIEINDGVSYIRKGN